MYYSFIFIFVFSTGSGITVKSLVDELEFSCDLWEDPEDMGFKDYVLYSKKEDEDPKPMLKVTKFDPNNPSVVRLGIGVITFVAEITDIWGAKAEYTIAENIETVIPTNEERLAFAESGIKEQIMVHHLLF